MEGKRATESQAYSAAKLRDESAASSNVSIVLGPQVDAARQSEPGYVCEPITPTEATAWRGKRIS